ncbi:MAG: ABC transporter substrate-binding protein [Lachnospiraceae bacterium]|nr:ABC transporter substrate-binding protein [Lachnospiraceae bacterium]
MKKLLSILLILTLAVTLFSGCKKQADPQGETDSTAETIKDDSEEAIETDNAADTESTEEVVTDDYSIKIGGLKGPTGIGLVKLIDDANEGKTENNYTFDGFMASPDEVTPKLVQGELDIAAVPSNLAAVLYNNTKGEIKVVAVNTLGILYIVDTTGEISSVADLKGKTIYANGKGSTPEYTLRYILEKNGLDPDKDVTIEWKTEATESVTTLAKEGGIAMMPQPFVTVAQSQLPDLKVALDLNKEWEKVSDGGTLITGVMVARSAFLEEHPSAVAQFFKEYKESTDYVNANPIEASLLVESFDIVKAPIAEKAIPYCNITCITGTEMKTMLEGYLQTLADQNIKAVGGAMPASDFYYIGE